MNLQQDQAGYGQRVIFREGLDTHQNVPHLLPVHPQHGGNLVCRVSASGKFPDLFYLRSHRFQLLRKAASGRQAILTLPSHFLSEHMRTDKATAVHVDMNSAVLRAVLCLKDVARNWSLRSGNLDRFPRCQPSSRSGRYWGGTEG